jgi:hypothetical protein
MEQTQKNDLNAPTQGVVVHGDGGFSEWSKDLMVFAILMEQRVYSEDWSRTK